MPLLIAYAWSVTLVAPQEASDLGRFSVLASDRKERFAGKGGPWIEETLAVERGGRRYRILFPRIRARN